MIFNTLFILLILLSLGFLFIILYKKFYKRESEGFQQDKPFILKTNEESYDDFYSEIYDDIVQPEKHNEYEIDKIIEVVQPNKETDMFLDIGSGTGSAVNYLTTLGYNAYGIEKSQDMLNQSLKKYPTISIKHGDITNSMEYDRNLFTHILCTNFTIYEFVDKLKLFQNCYYWMRGDGYLIVHLVDRANFTPLIGISENIKDVSDKRVTDNIIEFDHFSYKSEYDLTNIRVIHKETFTDKATQNIRQNERILYMENTEFILKMAMNAGFIVKGKITMENSPSGDKYQALYILERTL